MNTISRRDFLKTATLATVAMTTGLSSIPSIVEAATKKQPKKGKKILLKKDSVILFQGDSITDNGRRFNDMNYNSAAAMGLGYVAHTAAPILTNHAELSPRIYNKGISGNKVYQLMERWERDCFDLKPDVLSILIGVNDYWHTLTGNYKGTPEIYRRDFMELMAKTKDRLPDIQLVVCEPYAVNGVKAVTDAWFPGFHDMRAIAKEVADKYEAIFVPFQSVYDEASKVTPASHWTDDGVHSNLAGSQLMAAAWLEYTGL